MYILICVHTFDLFRTVYTHVQFKVLDAAASAHTNSWWWIKVDGVDVVAGLGESLRLQWTGDVDLCDGELQKQYQLYRKRLAFIQALASTSSNLLRPPRH